MNSCASDPFALDKTLRQELIGMCAPYVDVIFHVQNRKLSDLYKKTKIFFMCKNREWDILRLGEDD